MTLILGLKITFWVIVFLIGGGLIRYDKWERQLTFGIPPSEYGLMGSMSGKSILFFRLLITLAGVGVLRGLVFILSWIFQSTLF